MESTATTTADDQGAGALSIRKVAIIAGAIIAFLIGSGFATGQEILQYFASRGYIGVFGTGALVLVLMTFVCIQFITIGRAQRFERPTDIYRFLCGKVVGTFFDWFSMVFVFMSFWVMVAGAGAVFAEHYGLSAWIGGLGLAIVVGITGVLGLNGLVEVIGKIGPIIVAVALTLGIAAILKHPGGIAKGAEAVGSLDVTQASSSWWLAAISYVGFCMLWLAPFLSALGATTHSRREAVAGAGLGAGLFSIACVVVGLGLLANIDRVVGTQIPMLVLAKDFHPILAAGVSVIILAGIFTTAVPLLWTVSSRLFDDGSVRFRIATLVLAAVGTLCGLAVPFEKMVNVVYVINGYVGGILLAVMIARAIWGLATKRGATA